MMRDELGFSSVARRFTCVIIIAAGVPACLETTSLRGDDQRAAPTEAGWRAGDAQSGKHLFVIKGCVICHSVNDVGGRAALPLDAPPDGREVDPMVFAAAMWDGASAMLSLQLTELGYQIGVTGEQLRDLAAFASDLKTQADFTLNDVPADIRPWIIDAPHWMDDDWPEPFETTPEDLTSPFEDL